jgi:hypothetical protein
MTLIIVGAEVLLLFIILPVWLCWPWLKGK